MSLFNNDFEIKKCLVDMLDKVTFGQAEAITTALDKWEELEKLKKNITLQENTYTIMVLNLICYLNIMQERRNKMKIPTLVVKFKEQEELDEIKRYAHAHNMNVSEYIRYLVAEERKEMCNRTPKNDEVRE